MKSFYTYLWLREDRTPYYVGKGTGRRAYIRFMHNVFPPKDKSRIIVMDRKSEAEAFASERELIANWGRIDLGTGCLRNITDGGDGVPARSPEAMAKISQAMMGNKHGIGNRSHTGLAHSPETKEKMSQSHKGKKFPGRVSMFKGHHHTPESKEKLAEAHRSKLLSQEHKDKISLGLFLRTVAWG